MIIRKPIQLTVPVFNKMKRMGFSGQSYNDLIEDLIDFAKENIEDFNAFLDERYDEEGDE
jgi:predicted CopG family antitoxin